MTDDDLCSALLSEGVYDSYAKRYAIGLLQARSYSVGYGKATSVIHSKVNEAEDYENLSD